MHGCGPPPDPETCDVYWGGDDPELCYLECGVEPPAQEDFEMASRAENNCADDCQL